MICFFIALFVTGLPSSETHHVTPHLAHIDDIPNIGKFGDAQHRGPAWYDDISSSEVDSDIEGSSSSESISDTASGSSRSKLDSADDASTSASSFETKERKWGKRARRVCTPCPRDMIKKYKNQGIKWICGGYQRARRSFKSSCMMRYRNCEDGTMFVKLYSTRCKNDTYHGNHWFYIYRT